MAFLPMDERATRPRYVRWIITAAESSSMLGDGDRTSRMGVCGAWERRERRLRMVRGEMRRPMTTADVADVRAQKMPVARQGSQALIVGSDAHPANTHKHADCGTCLTGIEL